ncbi:PD-(D/E)XK nuclease family protein [Nannocystaceae bacterium ST9]
MEDLLARLLARIDRHSPGRVLVLVRGAAAARWLQSLLVERATLVGVRVLDPDALLSEAAVELAGPGLPMLHVLAEVRRSLAAEFAALADHGGYQRELLGAFVELERVLAIGELDLARLIAASEPESRDRALLDAFARFRVGIDERLAERGGGSWWRGQALARVLAGHERVAFLNRRAAAIAIGFEGEAVAAWEKQLIARLGFESWALELPGRGRGSLAMRLECAGPEAEIAAIARLLRTGGEAAALLAPADMIDRWAARLRHRDIPVRAWVTRPARSSAAARATRALLRIADQPLARRDDLDALLFGPALRPWTELPEGVDVAGLRRAWERQRGAAIGLDALVDRLRGSEGAAELAIATAIERLARWRAEPSASALQDLLDDWQLLARASLHGAGAERTAARAIEDTLARLADDASGVTPPTRAELAIAIDHALHLAAAGEWIEHESERGPAPVWLLPYDAVLDRLPARVFMTGLDRHPIPRLHAPLSDSLRERIGLVGEARRFAGELRRLDAIVASFPGRVIASHRRSDGAGNELAPGPWIAGRQDEREQGRCVAVGVDAIALAVGEPSKPIAPIERELAGVGASEELTRRVQAIRSHEAAIVGPHTGALGLAIPPAIYSASTLQSYAGLPFRYFVERVLGLGQREGREPDAGGLQASEQGQVVHRAIDRALAERLAGRTEPLEVASIAEPLLAEVLAALDAGYRKRAEHGQAEAIWASERDRWAVEMSAWWESWVGRLRKAWGGGDEGRREPDELVPAPFVLASEWSPGEGFELELGPRSIPFAAAIDRIEIDPYRQRVNVCDYKTGMPAWPAALQAELRAGTHLQLGLYALAVEQVMRSDPAALRLPAPVSVGALRLEYLKRPPPRSGNRPSPPVVRGFVPTAPLGLDARGNVWTVVQAAAGFALAFVSAIESGYFPVVVRTPTGRRIPPSAKRIFEVARVVPSLDRRATGLPGVLAAMGPSS